MSEPEQVLDDRKSAILRAIVEEYVGSAQPVGSQTIAHTRDLGVSAATVRNEMGALEREGYIAQPHTSAGRIPTDKGYRFYVDRFTGEGSLPAAQRREVADFFTSAARVMDDLLHDTSLLLARLTSHAAVIVGPAARRRGRLQRHPRAAPAQGRARGRGAVERRGREGDRRPRERGERRRRRRGIEAAFTAHSGLDVRRRSPALPPGPASPTSRTRSSPRCATGSSAARPPATSRCSSVVPAASRPSTPAFSNTRVAAHLLELLEEHVVMVALMRELLGPGVTVRIGSEHVHDDLRDCSVVLAPYLVEGQPGGTVGVLGPTRMDYRQAQAAVATVSRQLSRSLSP